MASEDLPPADKDHDEEPQVFAVSREVNKVKFRRRNFLELVAASATVTALSGGCESEPPGKPGPVPQCDEVSGPTTKWINYKLEGKIYHLPIDSPIPIPKGADCTCNFVAVPCPKPGAVPKGERGINYKLEGKTYTLPCNSPIPPGAVCTCNCVTVPSGTLGTVPKGETGINYKLEGKTYTLPSGSPIPPGGTCTCNTVSVPSCSCDSYTAPSCSCDSYTAPYTTHYWYPN